MCLQEKMLLALIDDKITKEDISENFGFVGLYIGDINRPFLDNHIFLLYEIGEHLEGAVDVHRKLKQCKNLYNRYSLKINGKYYYSYCFTISNKEIRQIINKKILFNFNDKTHLKIYKFWSFDDDDINYYTLHQNDLLQYKEPNFKIIPEEDYRPKVKLVYNEKTHASHFESVG